MHLALVVLIPAIAAPIPVLAERLGRNACAAAAATVSFGALALLLSFAPAVLGGAVPRVAVPWIAELDVSFSFFVDGLGLFFAALILGMGLLIILYARFYLASSDPMGRFYAYLLLFQAAMVGIVLSDNIIVMLVFWELTSLSSFLLIGYWSHLPASRQGARMALVVTGGGGLALIAGMLMLGGIAGTYELSEIIVRGEAVRASPLFAPTLALILLGAFTKSAQFPFHFWLPHAMAAPTPVSAYLHSATMVKAGIFLLARLWPVFAGSEMWFLTVATAGLATMIVGAWIAIFKDDLKALLAYSTVSHLGLITMLLGIGSPMAVVTAVFHILNHATFKAALFMSAGIVDHEAGTRNMSRLGGLRRLMPVTASLALVASAAMAGVPLLNGFVSKEMMLEEATQVTYAGLPWLVPLLAALGSLLSVAYAARLAKEVFFGSVCHPQQRRPHDPPFGMWLPVALLVVPVVAIGIAPALVQPVVAMAAGAILGNALPDFQLAVWHGFSPALAMSAAALLGGLLLLAVYGPLEAVRAALPRPDARLAFEAAVRAVVSWSQAVTRWLHTDDLVRYASTVVAATIGMAAYGFWGATHGEGHRPHLDVNLPALVGWAAMAAACLLVVTRYRDRLLMLIVTAIAGLIVSLAFLQFSAPDLALTQIAVEVVATILLLLALNLLPRSAPQETSAGRRTAQAILAGVGGLAAAALAYAVMTRGYEPISAYHLAEAKPGGGGTNVVNVILVDFRGYDTFGEIIVLGIAALVIFALLDLGAKARATAGRMSRSLRTRSGEPHPIMLVVVTRVLLPLALTAGIYIFLRGHNLPGGGFIAGIVVAIAFIMQYVASGYEWAESRRRANPQRLIAAGVIIAGLTGLASWFFGYPFLTSAHTHLEIPIIGPVELSSALAFDLGVFLVVVGAVLLALATISRVEDVADEVKVERLPGPAEVAGEPVRRERRVGERAV